MQLDLKKLAIYPRLSKDSTAFNAVVYVDGAKVGHAENDGHGGETLIYWAVPPARRAEIEAAFKALVPAEFTSAPGTAWAIDHLVEEKRAEKEVAKTDASFKRHCAKHGTSAARFDTPAEYGKQTTWIEFDKGTEADAQAQMLAKHPDLQSWTVIA